MPHERLRCLRWARELLVDIDTGRAGSERDRQFAGTVLKSFPTPQELLILVRKGMSLPGDAAVAIDAGGAFLREIRNSSCSSPDLRRQLDFVLRHYPAEGEALLWVHDACAGTLHEWLMPENVYADR